MTAAHPDADRPDERPLADLPAASIRAYPDGPLIVRGDFVLTDVDGRHLPTGRTIALCRCGRSAVKPFCDGSHNHARARRAAAADHGVVPVTGAEVGAADELDVGAEPADVLPRGPVDPVGVGEREPVVD